MVTPWGTWKPFPDPRSGQHLDAPIGPGVFEVRHTGTGEQIAFGHSKSVAQSLAILMPKPASGFLGMFARKGINHRTEELEYRTCTAGSVSEAKTVVARLSGRRSVAVTHAYGRA
jgi:hypothetical protein